MQKSGNLIGKKERKEKINKRRKTVHINSY